MYAHKSSIKASIDIWAIISVLKQHGFDGVVLSYHTSFAALITELRLVRMLFAVSLLCLSNI